MAMFYLESTEDMVDEMADMANTFSRWIVFISACAVMLLYRFYNSSYVVQFSLWIEQRISNDVVRCYEPPPLSGRESSRHRKSRRSRNTNEPIRFIIGLIFLMTFLQCGKSCVSHLHRHNSSALVNVRSLDWVEDWIEQAKDRVYASSNDSDFLANIVEEADKEGDVCIECIETISLDYNFNECEDQDLCEDVSPPNGTISLYSITKTDNHITWGYGEHDDTVSSNSSLVWPVSVAIAAFFIPKLLFFIGLVCIIGLMGLLCIYGAALCVVTALTLSLAVSLLGMAISLVIWSIASVFKIGLSVLEVVSTTLHHWLKTSLILGTASCFFVAGWTGVLQFYFHFSLVYIPCITGWMPLILLLGLAKYVLVWFVGSLYSILPIGSMLVLSSATAVRFSFRTNGKATSNSASSTKRIKKHRLLT